MNTVSLTNSNYAGLGTTTIWVYGGASGNTLDASALTGTNRVSVHAGAGVDTLTGGSGNDIFFAGGHTAMTGNLGANLFRFNAPGPANTITDFHVSASNALVFSDAGFNLGADEGLGTGAFQHLATSVFVANSTGTFTTGDQRFAYNTMTGALWYDPNGNAGPANPVAVASLTDHVSTTELGAGPTGNIFFVS